MKQDNASKPIAPDSDEFGKIDSLRPIGEIVVKIVRKILSENQESENGKS